MSQNREDKPKHTGRPGKKWDRRGGPRKWEGDGERGGPRKWEGDRSPAKKWEKRDKPRNDKREWGGKRERREDFRDERRERPAEEPRDQRDPRFKRVDPARHAALDVLREVAEDGAYANLIMGEIIEHHGLRGRDAGFATELAYGALRMQGTYDAIIYRCIGKRSLDLIDADVLDVLRVGTHQLMGMRVPDHAAVSATVDLAAATVGPGPTRFVNAVLRAVARKSQTEWLTELTGGVVGDDQDAADERLSLRYAHPKWIVAALREALARDGRDSTEIVDLLRADNEAPRVTLVARPGLIGRGKLADQVEAATERTPERGELSPFALILPGGAPGHITAVRSGKAAAQDEGSQVVALALASVPVEDDAGRWADLCAGPGGKTAFLGAWGVRHGAQVDATEVTPHRAKLVRSSVRALPPGTVNVFEGDGRKVGAEHPGEYDRVLVDVPCTGLGALRRRPESRWRREEAALDELAPLQRELLRSALEATRIGGVACYATCSPHVAETHDVVRDVLADLPEGMAFEFVDAREVVRRAAPNEGERADLGEGPTVQLWPHLHGTDAMFLALLRRVR